MVFPFINTTINIIKSQTFAQTVSCNINVILYIYMRTHIYHCMNTLYIYYIYDIYVIKFRILYEVYFTCIRIHFEKAYICKK